MSRTLFRIKPPVWTGFFLVTGVCLHYFFPLLRFPGWGNPGLAVLLAVASFGLLLWSVAQFLYRDTPLIPGTTATFLILDGPYRYSRNPIYVAMIGFLGAFSAGFGTLFWLLPPLALYYVLSRVFIPVEEAHLRELFPEDFPSYCNQVRRWF